MVDIVNKTISTMKTLNPISHGFAQPLKKCSILLNINIFTLTWLVIFQITLGNSFALIAAKEIISTTQKCASYHIIDELNTPFDIIVLFLYELFWMYNFEVSSGNSSVYIERLILNEGNVLVNLTVLTQQLLSGWAFWILRYYIDDEVGQLLCLTPLRVSAVNGVLIEGVLSFFDRLINIYLIDDLIRHFGLLFTLIATTIMYIILIFTGEMYTGGKFDPILSHVLYYNCEGHTAFEFIVVYWIAPIIGGLCAYFVYNNSALKTN